MHLHCYADIFPFWSWTSSIFGFNKKTFFDSIGSSLQGVYGEREGVGEREETVEARSKQSRCYKRGVS